MYGDGDGDGLGLEACDGYEGLSCVAAVLMVMVMVMES